MTQLVCRKLRGIEPGFEQMLLDQTVNGGHADAIFIARAEERTVVGQHDFVAFGEIIVDRFPAGGAHVDDALLVALADDADTVLVHIRQIQPDQLRAPDAAVEKEHQNRKIARLIRTGDSLQKRGGFLQRQVFRQALAQLRQLDVLDRVFADLLCGDRQIIVEGFDGGELSCACR